MSILRNTFCAVVASTSLAACSNESAAPAIHADQSASVISAAAVSSQIYQNPALRFSETPARVAGHSRA